MLVFVYIEAVAILYPIQTTSIF